VNIGWCASVEPASANLHCARQSRACRETALAAGDSGRRQPRRADRDVEPQRARRRGKGVEIAATRLHGSLFRTGRADGAPLSRAQATLIFAPSREEIDHV
jgi:hypothetical protein